MKGTQKSTKYFIARICFPAPGNLTLENHRSLIDKSSSIIKRLSLRPIVRTGN